MTFNSTLKAFFCLFIIAFQHIGNNIVTAQNSICDDGTICRNDSTCIPLEKGVTAPNSKSEDGKRYYRCDCSESLTVFYAGYSCEYPSNDICLLGPKAKSGISFCVNGGDCKHKYMPEDNVEPTHDGCDCKDGFEGDYCEYITGEAPVAKKSYTGVIVGLIITFVALSSISGIFIVLKLRKRRSSPKIETVGTDDSAESGDVKVHETEMI